MTRAPGMGNIARRAAAALVELAMRADRLCALLVRVNFGTGWRKVRMPRVPRSALNAWSNSIKVEVSFAAKMRGVRRANVDGRGKS
jgi:hypothetical protein